MFYSEDNKGCFVGRLAEQFNPNFTDKGEAVGSFTIYVPTPRKTSEDEQKSAHIKCSIFGKKAEGLAKYTTRGSLIAVTGYFDNHQWQDEKGNKFSELILYTSSFKALESKKITEQRRKKLGE
ncbi:single-stranded DNA-binding protein [Liquorilactobacillus hordei]|uniref:single-stranded DNA-binding protein n=1 Tax=Liquorilactobacillus hordei TaxID=468911 RepID=UPI001CBBCB3E|nr:single-stranded DNA-binding protein [Liquorilactobacillus hordei]MBZ2406671.1 hypothetical protein [Liquorilactobacillus hordei]